MAFDLHAPLLAELHDALRREELAEAQAHAAALALPADEQVAVGVRWPTLRVDDLTPMWNGVEVILRGRMVLHDGINDGDLVRLEWATGSIEGRVVAIDTYPAAVELFLREPERQPQVGDSVSVVKMHDPSTFIRYRQALERADAFSSPLKTALLDGAFADGTQDGPTQLSNQPIDAAQGRAAVAALGEAPLALIHGPPGTGKTFLLGLLVRACVDRGDRVWALAESNAAVDHLAATLRGRGLDCVRLGHPARVRADNRDLTVDARLAQGPFAKAIAALLRDLQRVTGDDRAAWATRRQLRRELKELRQQAWDHAVQGAQVIAATLGTLARVAKRLSPVDVAFVDEATQALEPAIWVTVPLVKRLVLVGDPEQLGPVVKDPGNPLEHSVLHRILATPKDGLRAPMLEVQHRMSTAVQALVAPVYGPAYRPAPSVANALLAHLPGVRDNELTRRAHLFVDTAGSGCEEARDAASGSLANEGEARVVEHLVAELRSAGVAASEIGVITPYRAQVARIRSAMPDIEVASVNAFQGREKSVIVVSWVRSNPDGTVGFVADDRRLTVAWSRARCLLIQVGDLATLSVLPRFSRSADLLTSIGAVESAWDAPWAEVLDLH